MARSLLSIETDYKSIMKDSPSYRRNLMLVGLMDELEQSYGTFRLYKSKSDMLDDLEKDKAIELYRKISLSRTDED